MRLYCKFALLVLATCVIQACLSTGTGRDTYFALRCYVATATGNRVMESQLVSECERNFAMERCKVVQATMAHEAVAAAR